VALQFPYLTQGWFFIVNRLRKGFSSLLVHLLPPAAKACLRDFRTAWLLARMQPASRDWGFDRGQPIDRFYIEKFLQKHHEDIRGRVLEIGEPLYTTKFGGTRVTRSEVFDIIGDNQKVTIIGDLATGEGLPHEAFDCFIVTQTYPFIYDCRSAVQQSYRTLKIGGTLLGTVPGICQIDRASMKSFGDYWRFTDASIQRCFGDVFGQESVQVETYGNVLAASAFLHGLASRELRPSQLEYWDPEYQVTIGVRAVKLA
jgi:hypothetical protein